MQAFWSLHSPVSGQENTTLARGKLWEKLIPFVHLFVVSLDKYLLAIVMYHKVVAAVAIYIISAIVRSIQDSK